MKFKPVQSLQRGIALIEALAGRHEGMNLKELSRAAGCSSAATFHLIQTLVEAGYVHRHEDPARYTLGDKLHLLAQGQRQDRMQQVVEQQMRFIHQKLPEASIYFSQYIGGQVTIRWRLVPQSAGVVQHEVNQTLPAYVSAGSLIHMAYWTPDQRQQYLSQYSYESYGQLFWGPWDAYEKVLAKTRKEGVMLVPERVVSYLKLGVPVLSGTGVLLGAITIQWNRPTKESLAERKKQIKKLGVEVMQNITQQLKGAKA